MFTLIIVAVCVAAGVGTGVFISKKRFDTDLADVDIKSTTPVGTDGSLSREIDRYEQLKLNLVQVKNNIDNLGFTK